MNNKFLLILACYIFSTTTQMCALPRMPDNIIYSKDRQTIVHVYAGRGAHMNVLGHVNGLLTRESELTRIRTFYSPKPGGNIVVANLVNDDKDIKVLWEYPYKPAEWYSYSLLTGTATKE